jgi:hypothetical protein
VEKEYSNNADSYRRRSQAIKTYGLLPEDLISSQSWSFLGLQLSNKGFKKLKKQFDFTEYQFDADPAQLTRYIRVLVENLDDPFHWKYFGKKSKIYIFGDTINTLIRLSSDNIVDWVDRLGDYKYNKKE